MTNEPIDPVIAHELRNAATRVANLEAEVRRLEKIDAALWDGTHDAYCAGDCGRLTANGHCRDCMAHGGVNSEKRAANLEAELEACAKRLRKFDDCIPTATANTTLRLERAHHAHELVEAVKAEREACAKVADDICSPEGGPSSIGAAIRARGSHD